MVSFSLLVAVSFVPKRTRPLSRNTPLIGNETPLSVTFPVNEPVGVTETVSKPLRSYGAEAPEEIIRPW